MKAEFQGLALSLIDFMGAFVPGMVWLVLIITAACLSGYAAPYYGASPLKVMHGMITSISVSGFAYGIMLLLSGLLLGYLIKPNVMEATERATRPESWRRGGATRRFPYSLAHERYQYFQEIKGYLDRHYPPHWREIPGHQPFSLCKRVLKSIAPALWEECEYREGELRLIGSLFLASILSLALSVVALARSGSGISWFLCSLGSVLLLCWIFRRRRTREVGYTYLLFLVALRTQRNRRLEADERA